MLSQYDIKRQLESHKPTPNVESTIKPAIENLGATIEKEIDRQIEKLQKEMPADKKLNEEEIARIREQAKIKLLAFFEREVVRIESEKRNGTKPG